MNALQVTADAMDLDKPVTKYRKDYTPTPYLIASTSLDFTLNEDFARVVAVSKIKLNHEGACASSLGSNFN